jgi:protein-tyrosine phosphatase
MSWTSETHPLRIDPVHVPAGGGIIGMTLCPGRRDRLAVGHVWERDLAADFAVIVDWDPRLVLTLLEDHEFANHGVPEFATHVKGLGLRWEQMPIRDGGVPNARFEADWSVVGAEARVILRSGGRILLHCRAGLGRTGMIAARLLVELGVEPAAAVRAVRAARADTIETAQQERHVMQCRFIQESDPL